MQARPSSDKREAGRAAPEVNVQTRYRYATSLLDQTELACRWRPDTTLTFVNDAYCRYFGKTRDQLLGCSFLSLVPDAEREVLRSHLAELVDVLSPSQPVMKYKHPVEGPSGEVCWQEWVDRAIFDDQGKLVEFQSVGRDVTERKLAEIALRDLTKARRLQEQVLHQATHDALTGLLNRYEFEHRVEHALVEAREFETEHALCYLDLDQFKVVNDTWGHAAGDELLRQVCALLRSRVRSSDTLARLGGDELGSSRKCWMIPSTLRWRNQSTISRTQWENEPLQSSLKTRRYWGV